MAWKSTRWPTGLLMDLGQEFRHALSGGFAPHPALLEAL